MPADFSSWSIAWGAASPAPANGFEPSFGTLLATSLVSLVMVLLAGSVTIPWLRRRTILSGHSASIVLNALHAHKQTTPSMGGLFVLFGIWTAIALFADWRQPVVQAACLLTAGLGALGVVDDLTKLRGARRGLRARRKLLLQSLIVGTAVGWLTYCDTAGMTPLNLLISGCAVAWIVGASNGVNVTDGLDGLAASCLLWAALALAAVIWSVAPLQGPGLLTLTAALIGGLLGFLFFNRRPARVFLGDTGSLPLGGLLGLLTWQCGKPLVGLLASAVFAAELGSVALQVGWFKWSGRRLFRCAPLHHHFQFGGWSEARIVRSFAGGAAICAALGVVVATLPRVRDAQSRSTQLAGPSVSESLQDFQRTPHLPGGQSVNADGERFRATSDELFPGPERLRDETQGD